VPGELAGFGKWAARLPFQRIAKQGNVAMTTVVLFDLPD
jgi:hypothetical protein